MDLDSSQIQQPQIQEPEKPKNKLWKFFWGFLIFIFSAYFLAAILFWIIKGWEEKQSREQIRQLKEQLDLE